MSRVYDVKWCDVKNAYPNKWLLIEALEAHVEGIIYVPDSIMVIGAYLESREAFTNYKTAHNRNPRKELLVVHSSRNDLKMEQIQRGIINPAAD